MLDSQYDGVILEDKWGKTYLCSNCLFAYADLGPSLISDVKDKIYGRAFLHDLEPAIEQRKIWAKMYQQARPYQLNLSGLTDFELRDRLIDIFNNNEMWIWQLSDGWGQEPGNNGIGDGGLAPEASSTGLAPVSKKTLKPGGGVTPADSSNATTAAHSSVTTNTVAPTATDDIANNPAARKALYAKHGIEVGPYKELQKITKQGYQREHFIPHSCFMVRSVANGEKRSKVPIGSRFGNYNEGDAITYFVYDAQSEGTEHRILTDAEKDFAMALEEQGKHATVSEWLDHMEQETARTFILENVERAPGVYEARVPDNEAALVAKCIRIDVENYLVSCGCDMNAPLSNLVGRGTAPGSNSRVDEDI